MRKFTLNTNYERPKSSTTMGGGDNELKSPPSMHSYGSLQNMFALMKRLPNGQLVQDTVLCVERPQGVTNAELPTGQQFIEKSGIDEIIKSYACSSLRVLPESASKHRPNKKRRSVSQSMLLDDKKKINPVARNRVVKSKYRMKNPSYKVPFKVSVACSPQSAPRNQPKLTIELVPVPRKLLDMLAEYRRKLAIVKCTCEIIDMPKAVKPPQTLVETKVEYTSNIGYFGWGLLAIILIVTVHWLSVILTEDYNPNDWGLFFNPGANGSGEWKTSRLQEVWKMLRKLLPA